MADAMAMIRDPKGPSRGERPLLRLMAGTALLLLPPGVAAQAAAPGIPPAETPPQWPQPVRAPAGAPNILLILTDDVGFGSPSLLGGPVPTPTFDALGREGAIYNRFNTTAICSPTRASLLTGRNPQAVGMGYVANWATPYEGYTSVIPKSAGTVARHLTDNGYSTAMFGKAHVTPEWEHSAAGPFDRWPTGLGFQYFFGFLGADNSAFEPSLVENNRPYHFTPGADYHLDKDLADRTIAWIAEQKATAPDKPFFVYLAPGTAHAPNHAPREWLDRFKGRFDKGWDELRRDIVARQKRLGVIPRDTADAPRPETLPAWNSLSADEKRLYARYMEAYAASLAYADHQIGRVVQSIEASGQADNTLIIYIQGDNGASAEGSFEGKLFEQSPLSGVREDPAWVLAHIDSIGTAAAYNLIPGGWGWAMNAPFPWSKRYASHFGGTRNGMVVRWPAQVKAGGAIRSQYLHVSDIMPTLLEAAGVQAPAVLDGVEQQPITGISFRYSFADPAAAPRRRQQIYAMTQNLSLYQDGWVAATAPMVTPWEKTRPQPVPLQERRWQLYDVEKDFSQAHDLAARHPEKLREMQRSFWSLAESERLLPIHGSEGGQAGRPDVNSGRRTFRYTGPVTDIAETAAPPTVGRSFRIEAEIEVPPAGARGVIASHGGRFGGYSLFLQADGRPAFAFNITPPNLTRLAAATPLTPGKNRLTLDFRLDSEKPTSGATVTLGVNGQPAATGRVERSFAQVLSHTEGFSIGSDPVSPVDPGYTSAESGFTGGLHSVTVSFPLWTD